jgi:hypothetical protein
VPDERRLPRRTRAQTRELLLLAGALVVDETVARSDDHLLGEWLSHVRLEEVVRLAAKVQLYLADHRDEVDALDDPLARVSWVRDQRDRILAVDASEHREMARSTAYRVFDSEHDFRAQLARALLSVERASGATAIAEAFDRLVAEHGPQPPFELMVAELADVEFRRVRELASVVIEFGAVPFAGHPLLAELLSTALQEASDETAEGSLAAYYAELLDVYGWRMRDGLTIADLAVALDGLIEGFVFFHRLRPEAVREDISWGAGGTRSAFSLAVEGIVRRFVDLGDDASDTP